MSKELIANVGKEIDNAELLDLTSFWGGDKNGKMLQFTVGQNYAKLTHYQVYIITLKLTQWLCDNSPKCYEVYN